VPEGDTIHEVAAALRPLLVGEALTAVRVRGRDRPDLAGPVAAVEPRGKHLLIELAAGATLQVHLGMRGSWHRYAPGERWRRSPRGASLVLETAADVLVCFRARRCELREGPPRWGRDGVAHLGPDLLGPAPDVEAVVARARRAGARPLGELLLDQTVAAGLGNVYKSELLFLAGLDPWTPAADLADDALRALYARGRDLLRANLADRPRVTRDAGDGGPRHWVYRRAGLPCLRCGEPVRSRRQGDQGRVTYWCPTCQPPRLS